MKAKFAKQYRKSIDFVEIEDDFGDNVYTVEGRIYRTKEEAKKAINELIEKEFRERYLKDKK